MSFVVSRRFSAIHVSVRRAVDGGALWNSEPQPNREAEMNAEYIRALERSHDELRGALILAGRGIRKLTTGKYRDDPHLEALRRVLIDARIVRKTLPAK
jgi:hypothetical protein